MIQVSYKRSGQRLEAQITLPYGMAGDFVWKGEQGTLHAGVQSITLNSKSASQTDRKDVTKP
jgi:hypothetical protein